jgi:hypothetical protein
MTVPTFTAEASLYQQKNYYDFAATAEGDSCNMFQSDCELGRICNQ